MSGPAFQLELVPERLVSVATFARALGVTASGLRHLIGRGRVSRPLTIRGRHYWAPDTVEFHVRQRRRRLGMDSGRSTLAGRPARDSHT
jgi:hypothetical protein